MEVYQAQNIVIRLATLQDTNDIIDVQLESIKILAAKDYSSQELQALLFSKSYPRGWDEIIYIAEKDRKIVGFASLVFSSHTIGAVFVRPKFARQGIASALLKSIEREAINHGIRVLWVCSSLTGHSFYLANGYKTLGKTDICYRSTHIPCIEMNKRIQPLMKINNVRVMKNITKPENLATYEIDKTAYKIFVLIVAVILLVSLIS